jgi:hypothetical protein
MMVLGSTPNRFAISFTPISSENQSSACVNRYKRILLNFRAVNMFSCSFCTIELEKLSVMILSAPLSFFQ